MSLLSALFGLDKRNPAKPAYWKDIIAQSAQKAGINPSDMVITTGTWTKPASTASLTGKAKEVPYGQAVFPLIRTTLAVDGNPTGDGLRITEIPQGAKSSDHFAAIHSQKVEAASIRGTTETLDTYMQKAAAEIAEVKPKPATQAPATA